MLSIFINSLILLSVAAFVFASITVWYMFGEKFHRWRERERSRVGGEEERYNSNCNNISNSYFSNTFNYSDFKSIQIYIVNSKLKDANIK
jgi:hypothetical protein